MSAPPPGFVRHSSAGSLLVVRAELESGARALGLDAPDALERAFAAARPSAHGRSAPARLAWPHGGPEIVLRRLQHGGVLGPLLRRSYLGARRPLRELARTAELRARGAPVPAPALAIARRTLGPLWECAIGTEGVSGDSLLATLMGGDPARARRAARAAGRAVRRFHDLGGRHADLNATNILIREEGDTLEATLIDLDRVRIAARVSPAARMSELGRLHRSLVKRGWRGVATEGDVAAFFAAYCAGDDALRRALLARVPIERAKLALHAWRYPRGPLVN